MNVRLSKSFRIPALLVTEDTSVLINFYNIMIQMTTESDDSHNINCAFERIKYWIHEVLQNSVLTRCDDKNISAWQSLGFKVVALPDDPIDQLVGIMIALKLNAICQQRLHIHDVAISSSYEDDMIYHHTADEAVGPFADQGWWHDPRPTWADSGRKQKNSAKVISLHRNQEWKDLGLAWPGEVADAQIVIADFGRDEK